MADADRLDVAVRVYATQPPPPADATATPASRVDGYVFDPDDWVEVDGDDADDLADEPAGSDDVDEDALAGRPWKRPSRVVVFDTETIPDRGQRLQFGSFRTYRVRWAGDTPTLSCVEEGLIYADDLPASDPDGYAALRRYAQDQRPDVDWSEPDAAWQFRFYSGAKFVDEIVRGFVWAHGGMLVGFNLAFDISRLAISIATSRKAGRYTETGRDDLLAGGFSLGICRRKPADTYVNEVDDYGPRVVIRSMPGLRRGFEFRGGKRRADAKARSEPAVLLDVAQLVFALTDQHFRLAGASAAYGLPPKTDLDEFGTVDDASIDYNRNDVACTASLLARALADYARHPIVLAPWKAYSPASIGKAYLTAFGITPPLQRQPDFPTDVLAIGMSAYYGGRTEVRIRRVDAPVAYCDFTSMYPTVNALAQHWQILTAAQVDVVDATDELQRLLDDVTTDDLFDPGFWPNLRGFGLVKPAGDILPVRAKYEAGGSWQIGVNPFTADEPFWYAIADLVAAKLLSPTGRAPQIERAIRIVPVGLQAGLQPAKLLGLVDVDPRTDDLFRRVIEERKRPRPEVTDTEDERISGALKTLANSTAYGINAEVNRSNDRKPRPVVVHRPDGTTFETKIEGVETPGWRFFSPLAALITADARLMLALAERCVRDAGGEYVFCDTDSLAIVANATGGLIACPGGPQQLDDGQSAIRALSFDQVDDILARFAALNPYGPLVPGSVLRLEDQNFEIDLDTKARGQRHELHCYAVSAKRYALFVHGTADTVEIVKPSDHGLGHILNPRDATSGKKSWALDAWTYLIRRHLDLPHPAPEWFARPAVSQPSLTTPHLRDALLAAGADDDQARPFNFYLRAHLKPLIGLPYQVDASRFQLVAAAERNPERWLQLDWADASSGLHYTVSTDQEASATRAQLQDVASIVRRHDLKPEGKSLAPDGGRCLLATAGLLQRRPVQLGDLHLIGKESTDYDAAAEGRQPERDEHVLAYIDPERDAGTENKLRNDLQLALRTTTINALAEYADLSTATVSRFKSSKNVNADSKAAIRRAVDHYRPDDEPDVQGSGRSR